MTDKRKIVEVFPVDILQSGSKSNSYIIVMFDPKSRTSIPILIGEHEAQAIIIAKENIAMRRPLTSQLLCNICNEFNLRTINVIINKFNEGIFYTTINITDNTNEIHSIDSRSSDAIAIALSMHVPIYITADVLAETGIKHSDTNDSYDNETNAQPTLEELEEQLQQLLETEEYEKAAVIQKQIDELKNRQTD